MSTFTPRRYHSFSVSDLFQRPREPRREVLFRYVQDENLVTPQSRTINIVLSRDIRANVALVNHMAVHTARKFPDRKIMVINTYAGPDLMKMTMRRALAAQGVGDVGGMGQEQDAPATQDGVLGQEQDAPATQDGVLGQEQDASATQEGMCTQGKMFPNLYLLEVPYGTWNSWEIAREVREQGIDILLWNSFEFSAISRFQRERIAVEMLLLQQERQLSVIVFSHEMKRDIAPMMPARGAIGVLAAHAATVWKLEEYDHARLGLMEERVVGAEESAGLGHEHSRVARASSLVTPWMVPNEDDLGTEKTLRGHERGRSCHADVEIQLRIENVHEKDMRVAPCIA